MASSPRSIFDDLKSTFESGVTADLAWRKRCLLRMAAMLRDHYQAWIDAAVADLGGGDVRMIMEIGDIIVQAEEAAHSLERWAEDRPAAMDDPTREAVLFGDRRVVRPTPKGVCLIIGAWNLSINVTLGPAIGVIAAGNAVVLKPSEIAPNTAALMERLVHEYMPTDAVRVVQGGVPETTELLSLPFDHICYTGSTGVGKIVMAAAAKNLTPCTLELGGKNPTFVHRSADLKLAADRLAFAKTCNSGQWCIDADYVLVDEAVFDEFNGLVVEAARSLLGDEKAQRGDENPRGGWFNRVVNERHASRVAAFLEEDHGGEVIMGGLGGCNVKDRFVPLTVVTNPKRESKLMTEEIFGPILVMVSVSSTEEAIKTMKEVCSTPLALYIYSKDSNYTEEILSRTTSGSVGVNTTGEQAFCTTAPFGGVGQSGFGAYHGKSGFDEFSHMRSIMYRTTALPLMMIPKFMQPVNNVFPEFVRPFLVKNYITGFVPEWAKKMATAGAVAAVAITGTTVFKSIQA